MPNTLATRQDAIDLLRGLVSIPSLSMQEAQASEWLVGQMQSLGFDRAFVDDAGNAVGEWGASDARSTLILLGHIDTVPGAIPVRVETVEGEQLLYGRGSVDAKGPLATFVAAVSRIDRTLLAAHSVRLVVVGAVEEEAATSKGARSIRDRRMAVSSANPAIGAGSRWGIKGAS